MKIVDPIYHEYTASPWVCHLINAAIIQRLRWIRLSNVPSTTYPMIAGISRYAHCIGVCILADQLSTHLELSRTERETLMCAGLLHDAGIPPLGHLMEEALSEEGIEFDHETSLKIILFDEGRRFQQLPDGQKTGIVESLSKIGVDSKKVFDAIVGNGKLGQYIASDIDLDNIDNILRIYISIFGEDGAYNPTKLAINYFSANQANSEQWAKIWRTTRTRVYNSLMFSLEDFSQKATTKRLIRDYIHKLRATMNDKDLVDMIRFYNDDEMYIELSSKLEEDSDFVPYRSGKYDRLVTYGWVESVDKRKLWGLRKTMLEQLKCYYVDFIPDKRIKYSSRTATPEKGALVGLFAISKTRKKNDLEAISILQTMLPNMVKEKLPEQPTGNYTQLDLV